MILLSILLLTLFLLIVIGVILVSVFGAGLIIIFGDVIVCAVLIIWIVKKILFKKRRK